MGELEGAIDGIAEETRFSGVVHVERGDERVARALVAERVSAVPYPDLVRTRVCEPAGMTHTSFIRNDEPEAGVAVGYLFEDGPRTNVLHLPVMGGGDGGAVSTVADIAALWNALFEGRIVSRE